MSIQLRLTLLYSAILTLTLLVFGVALYSIQATDTLSALKQDLIMSAGRLTDTTMRTDFNRQPPDTNPPPKTFNEFSGEKAFQDLLEREIVRILDSNGNLVASPFGREEDALPLSEQGLAALQNQQDWWADEIVNGEHMLIYSHPLTQNGSTTLIVQVARSLVERDRTLRSLAITLGGAGLFTILIAFGAGWALSKVSLRPIDRITQTAQTIGDERDFSRRVDYQGPQDEVGRLANTFNQMLSGLQAAYQKVEHSLQMQRSFVADVSHELRTPLTTLRGNLDLLNRKPPTPPEEQADILSDMVFESDRLIRLVNDLLLLARADARRDLNHEQIKIEPVIEETSRQLLLLNPKRMINLQVQPDLEIMGDRDAFKQVMLILLDNGIKHSTGDIDVSAQQTNGFIQIRAQDHGEGITSEIMPHIFDRFYRGENQADIPGFGLGLPIAKTLVENMGGEIKIESELRKGSVVTTKLISSQKQ